MGFVARFGRRGRTLRLCLGLRLCGGDRFLGASNQCKQEYENKTNAETVYYNSQWTILSGSTSLIRKPESMALDDRQGRCYQTSQALRQYAHHGGVARPEGTLWPSIAE